MAGEAPSSGHRARDVRGGRARRALSWVLIVLGTLALVDGAVTLLWQEPISALFAHLEQDRLSGALDRLEHARPTSTERERLARIAGDRERVRFLARELELHAPEGTPVGRIRIPRIGVDFVIVKGTATADLRRGPGVYMRRDYPRVRFPGLPGTSVIAGHRTTYLAPFRHIDALRRGDEIELEMPYARLTYRILGARVVRPDDVGAAVDRVGYTRLVLSACTPLFSAAERILVFARLTRTVARGAGAAGPLTSGARSPPVRAADHLQGRPHPTAHARRAGPQGRGRPT
jgi:sortase A